MAKLAKTETKDSDQNDFSNGEKDGKSLIMADSVKTHPEGKIEISALKYGSPLETVLGLAVDEFIKNGKDEMDTSISR